LLQSLAAPAGEALLELALLSDACRRGGAREQIVVLPYVAYARQDRCTQAGEALGGEVVARLASGGRIAQVVAVDLHSDAAAGWFGVPVHHVSALPALAETIRPLLPARTVIVSPDLGGAKRAERVARTLGLPLALVHKQRRGASDVVVHRVLGDVRGAAIVIVDDLISTGGTIEAAVHALRAEGCVDNISVLATHALLVGKAVERLSAAGIRRLVRTDSIPPVADLPFPAPLVSLAPLLATILREM
jgi:ribose-phosphate pyrophosphokinase